jgi:hypothetical protein
VVPVKDQLLGPPERFDLGPGSLIHRGNDVAKVPTDLDDAHNEAFFVGDLVSDSVPNRKLAHRFV